MWIIYKKKKKKKTIQQINLLGFNLQGYEYQNWCETKKN